MEFNFSIESITKNVEKWGCCGKKFLQRPLFYAILRTLLKNTYVDSAQYGIAELPIRDCPDSYDIVMLKRSYYQMNRREEAFIRYLQAQL